MITEITGNEPAMPSSVTCNENGIYTGNDALLSNGGNGLTIRQQFAAMAMQGMLANSSVSMLENLSDGTAEMFSKDSVKMADYLIAELNKKK